MSFPRYESYKDSGVEWLGEVPGHWEVKSLRRVISAPLVNGIFKKKEEFGEGTLLVNVFDVYQNDFQIKFGELDRVRCDKSEISSYQVLSGDLFFVRSSLKQEGIAVVAVAGKYMEPVVFECHLIRARPARKLLEARYGSYLLNSAMYRFVLMAKAKITTMTTIDQEALLSTLLPTPPVNEQSTIATFLDHETAKIDILIAEQQRLIELLKEKRQAIISHAVTKGLNQDAPMKDSGIKWLGEVPAHWEVKRLKHIKALSPNAFVDGPFGSNLKSEHFMDDAGIYVIESNFATQGKLTPSELKTISVEHFETIRRSETKAGDIIIAKIGAQFGKASILPNIDKLAVVSGNSMKLTVNNNICDTFWAYWQLFNLKICGEIDLLVNGSAQPALSLGAMNELVFLLPLLDEQEDIISFLNRETSKLDELTTEAQHAITLLRERRTALISAAVTGKIDVRGVKAAHLEKEAVT